MIRWDKIAAFASFVLLTTMSFFIIISPNSSAGTPVGGYIDTDTTWNLAGSPYWVESDVVVKNGANLTIEIGIDVLFNGTYSIYIEEGGVLWCAQVSTRRYYALFTWNSKTEPGYPGSWGAIQFNGSSYDYSEIVYSRIEFAYYGIRLESASPTIRNCTIRNCTYGINSNSGSPLIKNNTVENCVNDGIYINGYDVGNGYPTLDNNIVANNTQRGIVMYDTTKTILTNNSILNSSNNFGVWGDDIVEFDHDIDTTNTVDNKPIYYWNGRNDDSIPSNAGYVGIVNSTNITVEDLTLTNNGQGVLVASAPANTDYINISNVTAYDNELGIVIFGSSNDHIENCNISNNDYNGYYLWASGIYLYSSNNNSVDNNTVDENLYGISIVSASINNIVSNNTIISNDDSGIRVSANYNNMNNNTISDSDYGVYIGGDCNKISFNAISDNKYGIYLGWILSDGNTVNNNNASNNEYGIYIIGSRWNNVSGNIANSNSHTGIYIYYQGSVQFPSTYNIVFNNTVIDNNNYGIYIHGYQMSSDYNTISNNTVSSNGDGISLFQTLRNSIIYNDVSSNDDGITLGASANRNNVNGNTIYSNTRGIYVAQAGLNNITFCTITDNDYGIYLYKSESNNISYNNISSNDYDGLYFDEEVALDDVFDNIISWNGRAGINCSSESEPVIKSNDIENNTWYGVWSGDESDPVINYNNIANNGGGSSGDGYGVVNTDSGITIDAENNWWNAASGPSGQGPGTGDRVSDYVDYDPYSTSRF